MLSHTQAQMNGPIFRNDQLGIANYPDVWIDVPRTKELPAHYGLAASEKRKMLARDADIRIERNQQESRSHWTQHRNDKRSSYQKPAES